MGERIGIRKKFSLNGSPSLLFLLQLAFTESVPSIERKKINFLLLKLFLLQNAEIWTSKIWKFQNPDGILPSKIQISDVFSIQSPNLAYPDGHYALACLVGHVVEFGIQTAV